MLERDDMPLCIFYKYNNKFKESVVFFGHKPIDGASRSFAVHLIW